ncbi:hypothetical protein BRD07_08250 [Halobacteriales archaeon QS_9_68_42]|nr:MAG: hypothetical protein BRD07_08250 [Halobacteriales archaeon QS_9_68_42]
MPREQTEVRDLQEGNYPIINRKQGQVVSVSGADMQVMDLETYDTITMRIPDSLDPSPDDEIEYLEYEGQRKVV